MVESKSMTPAELGKQKFLSLRSMLDGMKGQFAAALPRHMNVDRLLRIALTQIQRTPLLLECTPKSFLGALMLSAQVGLEPDGVLGRAFLIPRRIKGTWEVCYQTGYLGQVELCQRSGAVTTVIAELVLEGDTIEEEKGSNAHISHRSGERWDAPIIGAYAIIKTKGGGEYTSGYWSVARLQAHRKRYVKNEREDSIWETNPEWAYKKTCIIQAAKLAPKSVEQRIAMAAEELADAGISQGTMTPEIGDLLPAEVVDAGSAEQKPAVERLKDAVRGKPAEPEKEPEQKQPGPTPADTPWTESHEFVKVASGAARDLEPEMFTSLVRSHGGVRGHADGFFGLGKAETAQRALMADLRAAGVRAQEGRK